MTQTSHDSAKPTKIDEIVEQIEATARRMELSDPDEGLPLLDRIVNRIVEIAGVSVLVGIVAVVFANASSRYLLNHSFSWAEEAVQLAMPWLAMTGVFLSVRRGTVIRIDFFFEKIPLGLQPTIAYAGYIVNVCVLLFMAFVSLQFVMFFGGDVALYADIPMGVSTSALVAGTAGAAMAYLAEFYREWRARQRAAAQGSDRT
jgi:TRAP-type C4-dicarboxylate transport system permease small subunit